MTADAALVDQWRSLLSRCSRIAHDLDRELQAGYGLTMSDYEALDRLMSVEDCVVRIQDLVGDMHLSQSALSRAVARLEKRGLVQRTMCETDRRGVFVMPTQAGRTVHAEAHGTYVAILSQYLG